MSLVPGFENDVFISYRQKDNKGGQWVTAFVRALETELEASFKETVTVYFDENPYDGLRENHDVEKSLERKLKSLIFIPILSQTYCDPKSFAWTDEFCAFNRQAKTDHIGRDIRLKNGNVASRILPIRIHDLEPDDKLLLERELGGPLRAIDFVYKAPGVNRPLKHDDHDDGTEHKVIYRNQINKVANAIKDIIIGIKTQSAQPPEVEQDQPSPSSRKPQWPKFAILFMGIVALTLAVYFTMNLNGRAAAMDADKSIAILPFRNDSEEKDTEHFSNGVMESILNHLAKISRLRVLGRTSVEQFRESKASVSEINERLEVGYLLEGSVQRSGTKVLVNVQLLETKTGSHVWSEAYEYEYQSQFEIMKEIAQEVAKKIQVSITPEEEKLIDIVPTQSLTAFDFYQRARDELNKNRPDNATLARAKALYKQALQVDPTYAQAYAGLALVHRAEERFSLSVLQKNFMDSVLYFTNKALSLSDEIEEAYLARGEYYMATETNLAKAIPDFNKAIAINPNFVDAYRSLAVAYANEGDYVKYAELSYKILRMDRGKGLPQALRRFAGIYSGMGLTAKADDYVRQALKLDGDSAAFTFAMDWIRFENSDTAIYRDEFTDFAERELKVEKRTIDSSDYRALTKYYVDKKMYSTAARYGKKYFDELKDQGKHPPGAEVPWFVVNVLYKLGKKEEGDRYLDEEINRTHQEILLKRYPAMWTNYALAQRYAVKGDRQKALHHLNETIKVRALPLWSLHFIKIADTLLENIRDEPEFKRIYNEAHAKYQKEKARTLAWMKAEKLL